MRTQKIKDIWYIVSRNVFLLTNGIIFAVVVLLFVFGDTRSALFIGGVLLLNISFGLAQDIRAWIALQNLQLLTAPHVLRIESDKTETSILVEEIKKGDLIRLKTGDQIPCDGVIIETESVEVSEGLITGESASLPRTERDHVLAGSVITTGECLMRVDTVFSQSRISRMTEGIKTYSVNMSPIQRDVNLVIRYSGYVLILTILCVLYRGFLVGDTPVFMIKNIGALASVIVPQGLAFAMTLLFAYGAAHLFNRNVMLQEINATEKLGRIHNLCMDKTGTLTENSLVVKEIMFPQSVDKANAYALIRNYIDGSQEHSQTIHAVDDFVPKEERILDVVSHIPFSSWRQYGAVVYTENSKQKTIVAGAPEAVLPYIENEQEKAWLTQFLEHDAKQGKRIFCFAQSNDAPVADGVLSILSIVAVCIIDSKLRPGIVEAIEFFQKRGVHIRIISGDSAETVRSIAQSAGVLSTEHLITGNEMSNWTDDDFAHCSKEYTIFARTLPEQKEKIIAALKVDGFTAMVGDGANDALALKKSDLGIAMFEGAQATRQVASVVLMNNSFTALPGGVTLADSIIKNAEVFAGIFFFPACAGLFLYIGVSILGHPFPFSPLNITLINYFTVGIPGILISYWTIRPAGTILTPSGKSFLRKVLPFVVYSALIQACIVLVIAYSTRTIAVQNNSNFLIILSCIITGFLYFYFATSMFRSELADSEKKESWYLAGIELLLFVCVLSTPWLLYFFDLTTFSISSTVAWTLIGGVLAFVVAEYVLQKSFKRRRF